MNVLKSFTKEIQTKNNFKDCFEREIEKYYINNDF